MTEGRETLTARVLDSVADVDAAAWDACAGDDNPFAGHAFLKALEDSGSVGGRTGWLPRHLALDDRDGRLVAAAPMYLKGHSYGEYVFDHAWASAYERAGGRYYPKLQVAVPFTPVTGPRLMLRPGTDAAVERALAETMVRVAERLGASSVHVTFPDEAVWSRLGALGWLQRVDRQFHWENRGYRDFADFLDALNSRKRKAIRRERREVAESGLRLHTLSGPDLRPAHWDAFHHVYTSTSDRKWGWPYLTRGFFHRLGAALADRVVLVLAEDDGRWVAGALNLRGADTLYGRNWGCVGDYPCLHFEACYYRAIDYAIAHGLRRIEAGAQGTHKIQRGYLPALTYSAHWIRDPNLRRAVADHLERERAAVREEVAALAAESPYRTEAAQPAAGSAAPV